MRLRRRKAAPGGLEAPDAPQPGAREQDWQRDALMAMESIWLLVDRDLRVQEASAPALALFGNLRLPETVIAFTRSAALEERAREALDGGAGPWEIEASAAQRTLKVHAVPLGANGTFLHFDDISEVRRLEAVRADFVANLAHELRTPVASLSLAAQTLAGGVAPEDLPRFVNRITEETTYIEGLLRTVSELAFLEGSVRLQLSDFWLHEVAGESWRRVVDLHGPRDLDDSIPSNLRVRADRVRVAEIMQNLFENAHRYSPPGSKVVLGASADGDEATVWVVDEGPGIPPQDLSRVFERFYKVDRARTRRGDGSGLGLAICKHLVTAHGGRIQAEAGLSGGTRIAFTLPVTPAEGANRA